jgi:hypothetical protein
MAATDAFETALLTLLFNNTGIANIGDASGLPASATPGSTQLSLHSTTLTDASTLLTSNELTYTGYARQTQARSSGGWTVSGDTASNAALIQFGEMTAGGPQTATHLGLGFIATGDVLRLHTTTTADLVINNGVNPQFAIGALEWSLD